jgi:tol-pal system protein YbgF
MKKILAQYLRCATATLLLAGLPLAAAAQQKVEDRLTRIERLLHSGALTEMVNQQEALRRTLQELQGEVELLRRDMAEIKQRQHDNYLDTDRRLRQLEAAGQRPAAATPPPAAGPDVQPSATPAPVASGDAGEQADYQAAFALLKAGRYDQAATAFQEYVQRYPQGQYAANALYWLGESYYVVRDFDRALPQFQRVLSEHAASSKSPDALLKIGFIHHERGDTAKARELLEKVKADYPNTTAAALAEQRLLRLQGR